MVIWLFSAHNQPYAFCVVTCTHSQCLPHIFITNVVCTTAALLYIHSDIYLQNIYWVRWLCASSFNDSRVLCVLCAVWGIIKFHLEIEPHTHMFIHNSCDAAFSYSMTEPMMVCALCIIICVLCVIFVFALYLDAQRLILNHISPTLPTHTHTRAHTCDFTFSLFVCLSFSSHFVDRTLSALRCNVDVFFKKRPYDLWPTITPTQMCSF